MSFTAIIFNYYKTHLKKSCIIFICKRCEFLSTISFLPLAIAPSTEELQKTVKKKFQVFSRIFCSWLFTAAYKVTISSIQKVAG